LIHEEAPMKSFPAVLLGLPALAMGCLWQTDLPPGATSIHVDPSRELVVTAENVMSGALAQNRTSGALSFRQATSALPVAEGATLRWLQAWSRRLQDEGYADRATAFEQRVTCPWLRAVPENQCDDACGSCTAYALSPEAAPFRLIAVTNRTDLSVLPDRAADGGEGRLVFAITDGPGDDASSPSLPVTVAFEYAQQGSALDWTQRWHALGQTSDAAFPSSLTALTQMFVAAGTLAQIRTADALTGPMLLHQFQIESREIVATNVRNSPDWTRVQSSSMQEFADANADAIAAGTALFPASWWAARSSPDDPPPAYVSGLPQHDALVQLTCGGCHALSANGFQIDPTAKGEQKLSRFLVDTTKDRDEMRRRIEWMQLTLWRASGGG
jgi:hypothetical protein